MTGILDDEQAAREPLNADHAEGVREDAPTSYTGVKAVLWLPDPEQRHWWREFYIREPEPKPGAKDGRFGF